MAVRSSIWNEDARNAAKVGFGVRRWRGESLYVAIDKPLISLSLSLRRSGSVAMAKVGAVHVHVMIVPMS